MMNRAVRVLGVAWWASMALMGSSLIANCASTKDEAKFDCAATYGTMCGKSCVDSTSCDVGLGCASGTCQAECSPGGGCRDGLVCSMMGTCVASTPGVTGTACATGPKPCPTGFVCSAGACVSGCDAAHPCASGLVCSSGKCAPADLFGKGVSPGGASDASGPFEGDGCVNLNVGFEGKTPTVMLVVDQSGSMFDVKYPEGAQATRWSVLRDALMDPTTGAVKQLEAGVRMGLTLYTSNATTLPAATCPQITSVPIAINNYTAINTAYQGAPRGEDTPTGAGINAAAQALAKEPSPKYILLVTDGEPDTCDDPNPALGSPEAEAARNFSIGAAQAAYTQGIGLFIVGVSNQIAPTHLQAMANAGTGRDPKMTGAGAGQYFVAADNQTALAAQLGGILGSVRNCKFLLAGKVAQGRAPDGMVSLDGVSLKFDDPNGFRINNSSELEILGTACEKIKTNGKGLSVSFPCDAVDIAK